MSDQRVVHRYELNPSETTIVVPIDSNVLKVGLRPLGGIPSIWIEKTTNQDTVKVERKFIIVGTGHKFDKRPSGMKLWYVGTFFDYSNFVWHVYEEQPTE